ncbi:glycosyltransferase family 2 protein [Tatumella sp. UBA2305]|uniref:glycosyltransferase family 2 protein n=1 Tax=Tatumella sp. UBA2305 TaxID=1947647 RepID=UPI0025F74EFE|nr:glycosyltransferase family 2 protein [Tatumella sp. UBA2305]
MNIVIRPCILIPCFNHGRMMASVISRIERFGMHCIVVDDGSDSDTQEHLSVLQKQHHWITLVRLPGNVGKGAAVIAGIRKADELNFTHAVQVDADGQHALEDIPEFLTLADRYPDALISGRPVYDSSIPKSRLYGRWITHFWVWIETLSLSLKDSMCGFRVYPIQPVLRLAGQVRLGQRMDFDTEIMVRLYWLGYDSHFIATRVTYPDDGISHFKAWQDNLRISRMHTRLFFGMLRRLPSLLMRHKKHWAETEEVRGLTGMRIVMLIWRLCGRKACNVLLYPIIAGYYLTAHQARRASAEWLFQVRRILTAQGRPLPAKLNSYQHFLQFGHSMLDKMASWQDSSQSHKKITFAAGSQQCLEQHSGKGTLILASHLGNIEACRALGIQFKKQTINAIVFHENAQRFKQLMDEIAPESSVNLLPVTDMGPDTAILIKDKLNNGEWVAIVGDRVAVKSPRGGQHRVVWCSFMGRPAPFPQGPFVLASALACPVILMNCIHQQGELTLFAEPFASPLLLPRAERQQALQSAVERYASRLQHYALLSPLEWFNFFDFWHLPDSAENKTERPSGE